MSKRRPDAVGVVVLRGSGTATDVLLLRRAGGAFDGAWTIVMGTVEKRERATHTARREVLEETGLVVRRLFTAGVLDTFYDPVKDRIVNVPFFVARVDDDDVVIDSDHDTYQWVSFEVAAALLTFPSQRRLIPEIYDAFIANEPDGWRVVG
jgi:dATP pyrophosphohydrolase